MITSTAHHARSVRAVAAFAFSLLLGLSISTATGQSLTKAQSEALDTYNKALSVFKAVLIERRAQLDAKQLPEDKPGQAIYLARNQMIGAYKDLTDLVPSKIGRPSKFAFPPAYFDADNEPLLEEYSNLFKAMQGPPGNAQDSATPFHDAIALGTAVGRAKGLDATHANIAGRIVLGIFYAETGGVQNLGNARSGAYKGSYQTGVSEDRIGQKKWAAIKPSIAAFDPALNARDEKEQARVGKRDQRYNRWTGVRNGLMNAHADVFPQIPAIVKVLPDPIDQLRLFELIQIVPTPTRAAIRSGDLLNHRISEPRIMGYLRNNSMFTFGKADRARTSATYREILDAMWLFNTSLRRALAKYDEITADQKK